MNLVRVGRRNRKKYSWTKIATSVCEEEKTLEAPSKIMIQNVTFMFTKPICTQLKMKSNIERL